MSEDSFPEKKNLIVVKRVIKGGRHAHHGGAWKIAYADFVTAMMAFFLLMWLLGAVDQDKLRGISEYFQAPLDKNLKGGAGISAQSQRQVDKGGGDKKDDKMGQVGAPSKPKPAPDIDAAKKQEQAAELAQLENLKAKVEGAIDSNPALKQFKNQLLIEITKDGLRIQIVDQQNRPMFDVGSDQLKDYTQDILREIGMTLNNVPNKISISGHTDAKPYTTGATGFSNWELSAERANATRRELIVGGMAEDKLLRVVGLSSTALLNKANPYDPMNRRISIMVMNKKAEELAISEGY